MGILIANGNSLANGNYYLRWEVLLQIRNIISGGIYYLKLLFIISGEFLYEVKVFNSILRLSMKFQVLDLVFFWQHFKYSICVNLKLCRSGGNLLLSCHLYLRCQLMVQVSICRIGSSPPRHEFYECRVQIHVVFDSPFLKGDQLFTDLWLM